MSLLFEIPSKTPFFEFFENCNSYNLTTYLDILNLVFKMFIKYIVFDLECCLISFWKPKILLYKIKLKNFEKLLNFFLFSCKFSRKIIGFFTIH